MTLILSRIWNEVIGAVQFGTEIPKWTNRKAALECYRTPGLIRACVRKYLKHFLSLYYAENCFGFDNLSFSFDTSR